MTHQTIRASRAVPSPSTRLLAAALFLCVGAVPSTAQEHKELGRMWTFENAPLDWFEQEYGFRPTDAWLDSLRAASVRFGSGCSASFVSPDGLIITNNHCAQEHVGNVAPEDQDWVLAGYFAGGLAEEVPIPGLTVQQVVATRDVSAAINDGLTDAMDAAARQDRLDQNEAALIDTAEADNPELTHELVTLYQGGMYQIYSYRVFDDIRLVCAPPKGIAEFGGDPDNFTFPRFCLDFALLRAWSGDRPADTTTHHLEFRTDGPSDGDAVFVSGNPGATGRLNTIAQMEYLRDAQYPKFVAQLDRMIASIKSRMEQDEREAKRQRPRLLQFENSKKAVGGFLAGLRNSDTMRIKQRAERRLREAVANRPELVDRLGDPWADIEALMPEKRAAFDEAGRVPPTIAQRESALAKRVGEAAFAVYGTSIPPDATLSIRISDGRVAGYEYNGTVAPWTTTLYGLYARHHAFSATPPFDLPNEWKTGLPRLDLSTRFNFVTTCDIIGGNSGSPLVDTEGRFVGLVFDGNIESLGNRFVFTDDTPRTICVHPSIIVEALRKVYESQDIADELEGKSRGYIGR